MRRRNPDRRGSGAHAPNGRPDAPWRYDGAFSPESTQRLLGDKENCDAACQDFVKTYRALLAELDRDKRAALWAQLQQLYANELPALPLFFRADAHIWPKWLEGVEPTGHLAPTTLWVEHWRVREG